MKIINTKLHGIFDYTFAFALILPWIVNFNEKSGDTWILASLGVFIGTYSLLTDYEFGLMKFIPMKAHLVLDILSGIVLIAGPFIFNMRNYWLIWPVLLGASLILLAVLSASAMPYKITRRDLDITKP